MKKKYRVIAGRSHKKSYDNFKRLFGDEFPVRYWEDGSEIILESDDFEQVVSFLDHFGYCSCFEVSKS